MSKKLLATIGILPFLVVPSAAQSGPLTAGGPREPGLAGETPKGVATNADYGIDQLTKFGTYDALKERLKKWNKQGKTAAELLAEDKATALSMVAAAKLQCVVTDGILVAVDEGAKTKTYEAACTNGAGYFLVQSEAGGVPSGFTCFAAEAAREADKLAKRDPGLACALPSNPDTRRAVTAVLARAGRSCTLKSVKWRGQNKTTDFLETTCAEGSGYMVWTPLPGSQALMRVLSCRESEVSGVACRLPENDTTLATLKAALARYKIPCDAEAARTIGRESVRQRQVVEYLCPKQQPKGLVVYIPAEGSSESLEALDCQTAAKRQAVCTLTKP